MSAHNPKVDDIKVTEARLREGAVAKALLERMTEAAVMRINEMSQDEMKQWGQVLKDSKANPEAPCPALEIRDAAAEILLRSDAPIRVTGPGDGATPAQALAQSEAPREGHHEEGGRQPIVLPRRIEQVSRQCTSSPTVGEAHTSNNRPKEVESPGEGGVRDAVSAVLPGALSNEEKSATKTTRNEVMLLEEARKQREERFEHSIGLEHWSWCRQTITLQHATEKGGPFKLNALFHWKRQTSLITHRAAELAGLRGEEKKKVRVNTIVHGEVTSTCAYWVPLEDWRGETAYLKARGVDYIAALPGKKYDQEDLRGFPQLVAAWDEQVESRGQIQLMIALDNWRYMPVRLVDGPAGGTDQYGLEDMKFLARTQFGKRFVLLDALDAFEVIPPETGDGREEKNGIQADAREVEEEPAGGDQIPHRSNTGELSVSKASSASSVDTTGEETSEVSRLKRATKRGFGFLSVDQEMRLREASTGARDTEEIVYGADCQARKLCEGILTSDPMLIIVAIEVSIQKLIKEVQETKELEEGATSKGSTNPIDSNRCTPPLPHSTGSESQVDPIQGPVFPKEESESAKEPQADGPLSDTKRVKEEAKKDHAYLSPDQENRVKKAASGFTNSTEELIRNANGEARLIHQKGAHTSSASAGAAIEEIVRILVDALVRCKDRKKMDEQIRREEEWIENEVERKMKERRFEDEVSRRVREEMDQRSKRRAEEIREIGRAAQRGWGFLNPDQVKQISRAAISTLQEPKRSQHRIDSRARRLCRENPAMSLSVLQAHVDEMAHDLVKELQRGQGSVGAGLNHSNGPGGNDPSSQEGYRACLPGGIPRGENRETESEKLGNPPDLAPGAMKNESEGRPWFSGLCADYVLFKRDWEKCCGEQARSTSQAELVQRFRENCMDEKTARHLKEAGSMTEVWTMLDDLYYVTKGLMVEFQGLTAIKKRQFEQQYDHYFLIQYSICAADEARQGHLLLVFANIEEMLRALPHREKTLWWDAWGHMGSRDLGSTFSAFVEERLDWSLAQMTGTGASGAKPTLTPTKNHKQDDGAGYSKRVKRGDGHEVGVRSPRTVRSPAERNVARPGGHAGRKDAPATVNFGDKPAGRWPTAALRGVTDRFTGSRPETPRFPGYRAYADDAIFRPGGAN
jgi:hypothetical protein